MSPPEPPEPEAAGGSPVAVAEAGSENAADLWRELSAGSQPARERLLAIYYAELRGLARRMLAGDSAAYRLQPTELANEAALRVLKLDRMDFKDRAHFLAMAATVMPVIWWHWVTMSVPISPDPMRPMRIGLPVSSSRRARSAARPVAGPIFRLSCKMS